MVVSTVPADGLAPLSARPSVDTVMIKIGPVYVSRYRPQRQPPKWHYLNFENILLNIIQRVLVDGMLAYDYNMLPNE